MTDEEFLRAIESCELPESDFGHAAHVRAGYLYLRQADFAGALVRIRRAIRNYAQHKGKPDRYHETITVAYVALIQQHICERGDGGGCSCCRRASFNDARPLTIRAAPRLLPERASGQIQPVGNCRAPGRVLID